MSAISIAIIVVVALTALVGYAVVSQSAQHRDKQKQRLLQALKTRSRNFKYMLSGFPPNFLTTDLVVLVHRCLIDVCQQLAKLDPKNPAHLDELQLYTNQMREIQSKPKSAKSAPLQNPQQIKEVRRHLQELNAFIANLEKRRSVKAQQAEIYRRQIKQLVLKISVEAYTHNAKQAQQNGKTRLALHYYSLAHKLLSKENGDGTYQQQISKLSAVIQQLEAKVAAEEPQSASPDTEEDQAAKQAWDNFGEDESWKKKRIYD